jgi:hypothetical protein
MTTSKPMSAATGGHSDPGLVPLAEHREEFRSMIEDSPEFCHRVLIELFSCQTAAEKGKKATKDLNHLGFTATDASTLSKLAERLLACKPLGEGEKEILRNHLKKYWRQFLALSVPGKPPAALLAQQVKADNVGLEKEVA